MRYFDEIWFSTPPACHFCGARGRYYSWAGLSLCDRHLVDYEDYVAGRYSAITPCNKCGRLLLDYQGEERSSPLGEVYLCPRCCLEDED